MVNMPIISGILNAERWTVILNCVNLISIENRHQSGDNRYTYSIYMKSANSKQYIVAVVVIYKSLFIKIN